MDDSPGVRTRRQTSKNTPQKETSPHASEMNGHALNGSAHSSTLTAKSPLGKKENVFLFYPNIIGYSRIVLAIGALYYMPLHPRTCSLLYCLSCLLDALDGVAARYFNQSTQFGAVLDMVTDRCTTSCLLVFLSSAFPRWALVFQGLISLDLASHYVHMFATLTMAGGGASHKKVDESRSYLLHLYYTNKTVLFVFCALNELFFISIYLLSFSSPILSPGLLTETANTAKAATNAIAGNSNPGAGGSSTPLPSAIQSLLAQAPLPSSIQHLFATPGSAWAMELARSNKIDSFWPWVLAGVSAPVMAGKQILNVVQLVKASKWLAEGDLEKRRIAAAAEEGKGKKKGR